MMSFITATSSDLTSLWPSASTVTPSMSWPSACGPELTLEVGACWVVVKQVIWRNQVLRSIAGHQLACDAVHPGILVQAYLIRSASPGVPDANGVEARDRLFLAVVVNVAEQA